MDLVLDIVHALFRWFHVVWGIVWIGMLYFFNFVNGPFTAKVYKDDPETRKKVMPELMPRALWWFRMGAAVTWITGILLLGLVYYHGGLMALQAGGSPAIPIVIGLAEIVFAVVVYDLIWKSGLGQKKTLAVAVCSALLVGIMILFSYTMAPRAAFIHVGATMGTIMAFNVWMRIWPAQQKIIGAVKAGTAPDAALVAFAGERSKHNTYMSLPVIYIMISNHHPQMYGLDAGKGMPLGWVVLAGVIAFGWFGTFQLYKRAGKIQGF